VAASRRGGGVVVRKLGGGAFWRGREGRGSVRGEMLRGSSGAFNGAGGSRRGGRSNGGGEWRLRPLRLIKTQFEGGLRGE
jgi:hypothetical protein